MKPSARKPKFPPCTEPWQSFYILRRGLFPCCYGHEPLGQMDEWATAWNSPRMQEIRAKLSRGKFSEYCLRSHYCPIVQRHRRRPAQRLLALVAPPRPLLLVFVNRALGRLPTRIWKALRGRRPE